MKRIMFCLLLAFMTLNINAELRITGMQIWATPIDTEYVLVTHSNSNGKLGAIHDMFMFIRTMDGEKFYLRSVGSFLARRDTNYWYVTPEIIQKLSKGVKQVKLAFDKGMYERVYEKDEIGKIIYDSYLSELQRLKRKKKKKKR